MKPGIHPTYQVATAVCACGNTFETRSTKAQIRTDICGVCHPFYTGEQRIIDTAGQVERFMKRMEASQTAGRKVSKRQERLQVRSAAQLEADARQREAEAREREATAATRRANAQANAQSEVAPVEDEAAEPVNAQA
ncbi:MAG: LSU ribosomal protein L31p @ LSU ribosomal protein L31p, zinc-dependent [uncultured Thermomicrobiales bacterium]|uniref:Large ribosomal subunit protein bL31 n=1 Tax=uncultured Thermomicrobiales bacterium TaxID=1645740 RepID=A0A6J4VIH7_9BACT|nr:MAG: LSU ribosomal protein L31p @ LSU ribosomal protein L31p, zinc-dependent [uncultured Thermomicrobiales bacterium]